MTNRWVLQADHHGRQKDGCECVCQPSLKREASKVHMYFTQRKGKQFLNKVIDLNKEEGIKVIMKGKFQKGNNVLLLSRKSDS